MKNFLKSRALVLILTVLVGLLILAGGVKGQKGNPLAYQSDRSTVIGSPFELSNSTARFALTESIVKNRSLFLDYNLAKFAAPDVVTHNGKYTSIFTPGVSFLAVPFYLIGDKFGMPQLTAYLLIIISGLINVFLIYNLSRKLDATFYSALISGFIFLFATNAFSSSYSFTQHNLSTTITLLTIINALGKRSWINNIVFGALVGLGILIDIPNLIMAIPSGIYILTKSVNFEKLSNNKLVLAVKISTIGLIVGLAPLIFIYGWYNNVTTGSYYKLAQSIGRTDVFGADLPSQNVSPSTDDKKTGFELPFDTRNQLNGFYILLVSNQRSWLFYSPVVLLGLLGFWHIFKSGKNTHIAQITFATILLDIILYSMFGDPYGGWSFGARYLIPGVALMCVGLAVYLTEKRNVYIYTLFIILLIYSIFINTVGVLTTSAIPPKVEVDQMKNPMPYTYKYNYDLLNSGSNSSLFYNLTLKDKIQSKQYYYAYTTLILIFFTCLNFGYVKEWKGKLKDA